MLAGYGKWWWLLGEMSGYSHGSDMRGDMETDENKLGFPGRDLWERLDLRSFCSKKIDGVAILRQGTKN